MIEIIKAIIYGIIQGISEFLPISSTAHLILLNHFLPLNIYKNPIENNEFINAFIVIIQLGSILSVICLYFKDLFPFKNTKQETLQSFKLWFLIFIASIPVGIIGILFDDYIDSKLYNLPTIITTLILYGLIFIFIEKNQKKPTKISEKDIKIIDSFKIGLFQMLALIPGTSRSGATIIGAKIIGLSKEMAAKFSFFLAIPAMFVATLLKIIKIKVAFNLFSISILLIATITSFIVSLIVIKTLMDYLKKKSFSLFGYYRIALGIILIIYYFGALK